MLSSFFQNYGKFARSGFFHFRGNFVFGRFLQLQPEGDVYERNGISKVRPDGTPKTDQELQAELKALYLAKKRQKNPSYGTIFNIGNIFKDE